MEFNLAVNELEIYFYFSYARNRWPIVTICFTSADLQVYGIECYMCLHLWGLQLYFIHLFIFQVSLYSRARSGGAKPDFTHTHTHFVKSKNDFEIVTEIEPMKMNFQSLLLHLVILLKMAFKYALYFSSAAPRLQLATEWSILSIIFSSTGTQEYWNYKTVFGQSYCLSFPLMGPQLVSAFPFHSCRCDPISLL